MWMRTAAAAAILAAGGLAVPAGATADQASGPDPVQQPTLAAHPLEGTDPVSTGCHIGAHVVTSWGMHNDVYDEVQGLAQLVYSPACGTNWVNVYGFTPGNSYRVVLFDHDGGSASFETSVGAGSNDATLQKYAPGNSCVAVMWQISNTTSLFREGWGTSTIC
ncbi:hypothetical protein JOF48_002792 [Arthrobacter stackebrandtii]|uniref:DUF2690 domain-containing protein n=1 Tax=Arthrobacter stackebrandtii TaxID=272161 RepID=A0ABS4YYX7_9MICC|nr:hypothetical protein [Arthrobacter stackebrandtii]MBP2413993.1 hypothetical protein [Arthrobacter stackebrandtii]PYG99007.1 hypothetical protein CVV67_17365 [Arthrobacter stackebrandtii]